MTSVAAKVGAVSVRAYRGDAKTLLAFNIEGEAARKRLSGFTIQVKPPGIDPYYIQNNLRFEKPGDHAQLATEPAFSSINAPVHKFRWVHVPGLVHQGLKPVYGAYTYYVTPRYFNDKRSLLPLDTSLTVKLQIKVDTFAKGKLKLGFTRGFTQSQAFVRHFGLDAVIKPKNAGLLFDTSQQSGTNAAGEKFTFDDQYQWLGFTAQDRIFEILDEVKANKKLKLDVFVYDLSEPNVVKALLDLGASKRVRVILDNAALHHNAAKPKPEDEFEALFIKRAGADRIKRGKFGRYAHNKVLIVSNADGPQKILTGSTNFSVTGLYVNSNHVLVFDDPGVAKTYAGVFEESWADNLSKSAFSASKWATKSSSFKPPAAPNMSITFSPHSADDASLVLGGVVDRVKAEADVKGRIGSVLFAVMQLDGGVDNPVYDCLNAVHKSDAIFSYGISDTPNGISLYEVGKKKGVLVTGKPVGTQLPPPFSQVPNVGLGHQVHHKFVVCGFNGPDAVVYCGSSNLALKGEEVNGDNLLAIRDGDVATVFAIEALALVDHFEFLDRAATGPKAKASKTVAAVKQQAAASAGWFLGTSDRWAAKFFDPNDLHFMDRELFAG